MAISIRLPVDTELRDRRARAWLKRDAALIPLAERGKAPVNKHGSREPLRTWKETRKAFFESPNANYGIVTGTVSNLVVLDVDGSRGAKSLRALEMEHGCLPATVTVLTGRGRHFYFRHPGKEIRNSANKLGRGLDIRSDGGYVVGPGSVHSSGTIYRYAPERSPQSVEIAEMPGWLSDLLTFHAPKPTPLKQVSTPALPLRREADPTGVPDGSRNQHLTSLAGRLQNTNIPVEVLVEALWAENQRVCDPPLDRAEVEKIAASVGRYLPKNRSGDEAEDLTQSVLDGDFAGGKQLLYAADGQFWAFNSTHWTSLPRKALEGIVLRAIQALPSRTGQRTASLIGQALTLLTATTAARDDVLRFNSPPPPVINCRNGELWVGQDGTVQLKPHDSQSYLRNCLEVDYDPKATCSLYDKTVAEIFAKAPDGKALTDHWHEVMGYAVQPDRRIAQVVIARGQGNDGKTSLVETLVRLVGRNLVTAMPVQNLEQSRFTIGGLLGKYVFLDDDVKTGTRLPDGQLKRLSEEKTVTGEHKFGQPFTFTVRTLPILLCNNPPSLADLSKGMLRRLMVIPFDRSFGDDEVDRALFPTIWATEMSGVLNHALAGLARVMARGWWFDPPGSVERAKKAWLIEANPLPAFIDARCEPKGSCWLEDLYNEFCAWASANGITRPQQKPTFKRNLQSSGFAVVHGNKGDKVKGLSPRP